MFLAGCYAAHSGVPPEGEIDPRLDTTLAGHPDVVEDVGLCREAAPVDLLFVIDSSPSMEEERAHLIDEVPALLDALVTPPDANGDDRPDWMPIRDMHIGIVTTDMIQDGRLLRAPMMPGRGCSDSYPSFLSYDADADDPMDILADFSCLADVGSDGSTFEQPLESALKALTPRESDVPFAQGYGHGSGANAGFLRPGSVLVVMVLTDEDDCSLPSTTVLRDDDPRGRPPCTRSTDPLYPVDRYIDGFAALRPDGSTDRFVYGLIAGVPRQGVQAPTEMTYDDILEQNSMIVDLDASTGELIPACEGLHGMATPARRLVQVARAFDAQSALASICEPDYTPMMGAVAHLIGTRACVTDLPDGIVPPRAGLEIDLPFDR